MNIKRVLHDDPFASCNRVIGQGGIIIEECEGGDEFDTELYYTLEERRQNGKAKGRLIEQTLERYIVPRNFVAHRPELIYYEKEDGTSLTEAETFAYAVAVLSPPCIMRIHEFKHLVSGLGNKDITYAYIGKADIFIDVETYLHDQDITLRRNGDTYQLILPPDC